MRLSYYLNGNLAATTLGILLNSLSKNTEFKLVGMHGSEIFHQLALHSLPAPKIEKIWQLQNEIKNSDLFVCSPMSPGKTEARLIHFAHTQGIRTLLYLSDIELSTHKVRQLIVLPDYIAVADIFTFNSLVSFGYPVERILRIGQPFFEAAFRESKTSYFTNRSVKKLLLLEVPNSLDKQIAYPNLPYTEKEISSAISEVANQLQLTLTKRPHPKMSRDKCLTSCASSDTRLSSLECMLSDSSLCISTYSTGLVEAYCLGYPVISYQPVVDRYQLVRSEAFHLLSIPVVQSKADLSKLVREGGNYCFPNSRKDHLSSLFFNYGFSLDVFSSLLNKL
jgi:hypothetical protein